MYRPIIYVTIATYDNSDASDSVFKLFNPVTNALSFPYVMTHKYSICLYS